MSFPIQNVDGGSLHPTTAVPQVPIPVEESRAQRLQRQQARFRDRGGIFVPSNRNTLIDILLGRKVQSPKKGARRSISCSPTRIVQKAGSPGKAHTQSTGMSIRLPANRSSPRKAPKAPVNNQGADEPPRPIAGTSTSAGKVTKSKSAKKPPKGKAKASGPTATQDSPPKRRGRPLKTKLVSKVADPAEAELPGVAQSVVKDTKPMQKGRKGRKPVVPASPKAVVSKVASTSQLRKAGSSKARGGEDYNMPDEMATTMQERVTEDEDGSILLIEPSVITKKPKLQAKGTSANNLQDIDGSKPKPTGKRPRRTRTVKVKEVCPEPPEDDGPISPNASSLTIPSEENSRGPSKKDRKRPIKEKGHQRTHIEEVTDPRQEAEDSTGRRSTSKKRMHDVPDDTTQSSRKRAKIESHLNSSGDTDSAVDKPKPKKDSTDSGPSRHAHSRSEGIKSSSIDKQSSGSKKRSLEVHAETPEVEKKPTSKRKKTESTGNLVGTIKEVREPKRNKKATKASKLASSKQKENVKNVLKDLAPTVMKSSIKDLSGVIALTRRPPDSVLRKIKKPLPEIEDDTPDPIDLFL